MMRRRQRLIFLATGYLVSLLYTFGLAFSLIKTHHLQISELAAILYTAVLLLILTCVFYNKWTTIISLVGTAAYAYWTFRYSDAMSLVFDEIIPFAEEAWVFLRGLGDLQMQYHLPLALIFILIPMLFSLISASRLRGCPSMVIVATAVFVSEWSLGHHNIFLPMAFSASAIAAVYAYSFARRLFLRDMSDSEGDYTEEDELFLEGETVKADNRTVKIPNATVITVLLVPLALIAALLAGLVIPENANNLRIKYVENAVDDVVDYIGQFSGFTRKKYSFSISAFGYSSTSELGGPVSPSEDIALVVEGISPSLLKGSTKSYYSGKGWLNYSGISSHRYNSPLWASKRTDVFDLERPDPDILKDKSSRLYRTVRLKVTHYQNFHTVFSPPKPRNIYSPVDSFVPYFNDLGELFPKKRLNFLDSYTIEAQQFMPFSSVAIDYMTELEKLVENEPEEKMEKINELYLQLPDSLPPYVWALGNKLALSAESESKFLQAMAIKDYLTENFTYTLSPSYVPDDRDFVDYFLETRSGYCTYYATAMVVLARTAGIPARYCEGFMLTNAPHTDFVYTVTGERAHAWAELYFEGIGWIPFDATPIGQPSQDPIQPPIEITEPDIPSPEPTPIENIPEEIPEIEKGLPSWVFWIIIITCILIANTLIIIAHRIRYASRRLVEKYGKIGAIEIWWRSILDLLSQQDKLFQRRQGETAAMLSARIGKLIDCKICTFDQLVRIVMRSYYSGKEPSDTEVDIVYRYFVSMENRMMKTNTPPVYVVKRILLPRAFGFRGIKKGNKLRTHKSNLIKDKSV
jgi:transglutaminase-like putative cysteine protease